MMKLQILHGYTKPSRTVPKLYDDGCPMHRYHHDMEESASLPDRNQLGTEIIGRFISPLSFFSGRMTEWLRDTKQAIVSSPPTTRVPAAKTVWPLPSGSALLPHLWPFSDYRVARAQKNILLSSVRKVLFGLMGHRFSIRPKK